LVVDACRPQLARRLSASADLDPGLAVQIMSTCLSEAVGEFHTVRG
jgi:hypothetical protein